MILVSIHQGLRGGTGAVCLWHAHLARGLTSETLVPCSQTDPVSARPKLMLAPGASVFVAGIMGYHLAQGQATILIVSGAFRRTQRATGGLAREPG